MHFVAALDEVVLDAEQERQAEAVALAAFGHGVWRGVALVAPGTTQTLKRLAVSVTGPDGVPFAFRSAELPL